MIMPISERQLELGVVRYLTMLDNCRTHEDTEKCKGYGEIVFKQLCNHKLFGKAQMLAHRAYVISIGVKDD